MRILILQESTKAPRYLHQSLSERHELLIAENDEQAMSILDRQKIDLIIARVHMEHSNVFHFLREVKKSGRYAHIPFICYCGQRTATARSLDPLLARTSEMLGAHKYINIQDYCCGDACDLSSLRAAIEGCWQSAQT